jgi:hypothetical protein
MMPIQIWELRQPDASAARLHVSRSRLDAAARLLVHAAPMTLEVEVRDERGSRLALGENLGRTGDFPMARLTVLGDRFERTDGWPTAEDIGRPVILPGGEVGILTVWWNADDGSAWRWSLEFFNRR